MKQANCAGCGIALKLTVADDDATPRWCWSCWPEKKMRTCTPYTEEQKQRMEEMGYWTKGGPK
jgi:hypothetical protein